MAIADTRLLDELTDIASAAAAAIRAIARRALDPRQKADRSVVTAADEAAEALILEGLTRLLPGTPIISEEAAGKGERPALAADFVLVDPLDGTRDFLDGEPDFTVNIAVVSDHTPVLGVVAAPARDMIWRGIAGHSAERLGLPAGARAAECRERSAIHTRSAPATELIVAVSRSHLDPATADFVARLPTNQSIVCGSAIKFCRVAEGSADIYPRLSPTSEWDVAAGHAVLTAAGGIVTTPAGQPMRYGASPSGFGVPAFIAWGDRAAAKRFAVAPA
jgi:3'(2'), 5'-bisphosphate nucleotidase